MSLRSQIEVNVNNIKYLTSPTVNHARSQLYKNSVLRQNNSILANSMSKSFPAFPKQSPNFIHPFGKYTIQYLNMTQQTMFFSEKKPNLNIFTKMPLSMHFFQSRLHHSPSRSSGQSTNYTVE